MILPQSRAVIWAGVAGLLLATIAAIWPDSLIAVMAACLACVAIALIDAVRGRTRIEGIRPTFPELIRLTKNRPGEFQVRIALDENKVQGLAQLRLAVGFPPAIASACLEMTVALQARQDETIATWPCTATTRGNFALENIHVEVLSPWGLWAVRRTNPARAEVRVYPNTLPDQSRLAALFLNRGMFGLHAHRQIGKGREFDRLRDYIPGDSFDDVSWKATAKRGRPVTKLFQIERTQEVYVAIDASRLSGRQVEEPGGGTVTELERFVTASLVLGMIAEKQGDLFGVIAFDDRVRNFIRARGGKGHFGAYRDALYALEPRIVNPGFAELSSFIGLRLRRRALIIVLTNLDDPVLAEDFMRHASLLAAHHLVLVISLSSPGVARLFSDARIENVDDIYHRLGGALQWRTVQGLQRALKQRGVVMSLLDNALLGPQLVSRYLDVKRRQIL